MRPDTIKTDIVVIGAGIAGLAAALQAQALGLNVALLCKGEAFSCGSSFINPNNRWGITYARNSSEVEALTTIINRISRGTNVPELTSCAVAQSYEAFKWLTALGVEFVRSRDGEIERVAPCFTTLPFASLISSIGQFAEAVRKGIDNSVVRILPFHHVETLLFHRDSCAGCLAVNRHGGRTRVLGKAVVLSNGGDCASHAPSMVEQGLVGDGYRLLKEVGVSLKNMKYRQYVWEDVTKTGNHFATWQLFDEAVRFEAYNGADIPVDTVNRSMVEERKTHVPISNLQRDRVFDDVLLTFIPHSQPEFAIRVIDRKKGLIKKILPHCQASNGGVEIGLHGETPVRGLYAAGEVATGPHGGDRVGGMMITSAIVYGRRAVAHARHSYIG